MIPLLCHPQSRAARSPRSFSAPTSRPSLSRTCTAKHVGISDRCVSRCFCELVVLSAAFSVFSGPGRRDGAAVPFTPQSNKGVCYFKPDKEHHKFLPAWNSPSPFSCCSLLPRGSQGVFSPQTLLFFSFFLEFWQLQVWSSTLHETDWHWKEFWHDDGKSNSVISVIWRKEVNVCESVWLRKRVQFHSAAKTWERCYIIIWQQHVKSIMLFQWLKKLICGWDAVLQYRGAVHKSVCCIWMLCIVKWNLHI